MNTPRAYLTQNNYKKVFNLLYSNFLKDKFSEKEIFNFSLKFNSLVDFCLKSKPIRGDKIFCRENEYNFIEFSYENSEAVPFHNFKKIVDDQLINLNKIKKENLHSFFVVEILKALCEKG